MADNKPADEAFMDTANGGSPHGERLLANANSTLKDAIDAPVDEENAFSEASSAAESVALLAMTEREFVPAAAAFWKPGEHVPFLFLARAFDLICDGSDMLAKPNILCNVFRTVIATTPEDMLAVVTLSANRIAPAHEGVELRIGDAAIIEALAEAYGRKDDQVKAEMKVLGDLGLVAKASRTSQKLMFKPPPLTCVKVLETFREIAKDAGNQSQDKKLGGMKALLVAATDCEPLYVVRLLQSNLQTGLAEETVLAALAHAAVLSEVPRVPASQLTARLEEAEGFMKETYSVLPIYEIIINAILQHGIRKLPEICNFTSDVPVGPMLAKPTTEVSQVLDKFQDVDFSCEYKYNGERAQIHCLEDGSIEIYSGNAESNTWKFPDVIEAMPRCVKPEVKTYVIDCEVVAYDREKDKILSSEMLSSRGGKGVMLSNIEIQVCLFASDLLYLNGRPLLNEQLNIRRELMYSSFQEVPGVFKFAIAKNSNDLEEIPKFLDDAINDSCEGLIVKTLSKDATFEPAKRSNNRLKLEKDYMNTTGDSSDLAEIVKQEPEVLKVKAADLSISPVHREAVGLVDPTKDSAVDTPVIAPPQTASALKQIRTSSLASKVTAPPRTASPARQMRNSPAAASVAAPPRTASPARQTRTSSTTSSVSAPPRTASPLRHTRTLVPTPVSVPPRAASPSRQPRTSSTATTGTGALRPASPLTEVAKTSRSISQNGLASEKGVRGLSPARARSGSMDNAGNRVASSPRASTGAQNSKVSSVENSKSQNGLASEKGVRGLSPARARSGSMDNAGNRVASSPRASTGAQNSKVSSVENSKSQNGLASEKGVRGLSPARARSGSMDNAGNRVASSPRPGTSAQNFKGKSVENPKSSSVIVPFPPTSMKSVKPALTSLKISPRPSPSSSPRAPPNAENPRASGVIVPFPLTAVKSMPKPSVTAVKSSPRPASPSVKPAPRSASPSVKAAARPASPSVKPLARPAPPSVKTPVRPASPSVKSTPRAASPSARATIGASPRKDPVNAASRAASPSPAARKSTAASPSQPPPASPRASEKKPSQISSLNSSLSAPSRAGSITGKPVAVGSVSPATSARSVPSLSSSSQSLLKPKIGSLTPSFRRSAQLPPCENPQNLSSGSSDPRMDMPHDAVDAAAARSVVQEAPPQRLRIASFKRNNPGAPKTTEIVSPEVPAHLMTSDTKKRCGWITSQSDDIHIAYHDNEWGVPVYDDKLLFELIVLQGAQAELNWPTILARRNNFRAAFANFDPAIVARFDERKILSLIADSSICFPETKVRGVVDNAAHVLKIMEEYGSLSKFLWSYVNHKPIVSQYKLAKQVPVKTPKSEALSKELLRRGFRFVGPTTVYSVMQAAGLVCDHLVTCYKYQESSAENSPVKDLEDDKAGDSWQRISLPEWRTSIIEPRAGAVDVFPHEFRRASSSASDPVWAELPIIEEAREDIENNSDNEDECDLLSTSSKCEVPVC